MNAAILVAHQDSRQAGDQEVAGSTPTGLATFFHGDWSWNIFYSHSHPSADSRRAFVSFWQKMCTILVNCRGLSRARDKGSIGVKYPNVFSKYSIFYKKLGYWYPIDLTKYPIITKFKGENWSFKASKAPDYCFILWLLCIIGLFILHMTNTIIILKGYKEITCSKYLNQAFCAFSLCFISFTQLLFIFRVSLLKLKNNVILPSWLNFGVKYPNAPKIICCSKPVQ